MQMPPCQIQKQASSKLGVLYWLAVWGSGEAWQLRSNGGPVLIKLEDDHQLLSPWPWPHHGCEEFVWMAGISLAAFDKLKQNLHGGSVREKKTARPQQDTDPILWRANGPNSKPKTTERAAKLNLGRRVRHFSFSKQD